MPQWFIYLIVSSITTAIIGGIVTVFFSKLSKRMMQSDNCQRDLQAANERNLILIVKSLSVSIELGRATALAVKEGKTNGEMTSALNLVDHVQREHEDFMREQGIQNLQPQRRKYHY